MTDESEDKDIPESLKGGIMIDVGRRCAWYLSREDCTFYGSAEECPIHRGGEG